MASGLCCLRSHALQQVIDTKVLKPKETSPKNECQHALFCSRNERGLHYCRVGDADTGHLFSSVAAPLRWYPCCGEGILGTGRNTWMGQF